MTGPQLAWRALNNMMQKVRRKPSWASAKVHGKIQGAGCLMNGPVISSRRSEGTARYCEIFFNMPSAATSW